MTNRQTALLGKLTENPRTSIYRAMLSVGYSHHYAAKPKQIAATKGFQELLAERLGDDKLTKVHDQLLKSRRLDHMVFPTGPKEDDGDETHLSDVDIRDMLAELGCTVRRVVHGEMARHVYFWAPNDKTREGALKLAYQVRGKLDSGNAPPPTGDTYNTFIQNNQVDPNTLKGRKLVDATVEAMMTVTKRDVKAE